MGIVKPALKCASLGVFAAMGLCAAVLSGCSVKASTDAVEQTQVAKVEQAEVDLSDAFTTEDKPTKTIETPWGPREVYDPAKDPLIISEFKPWFDSGFKPGMQTHEGTIIGKAKKIKGLDYLRHQCMSVAIRNECVHFNYTFKAHCADDQNIHKLNLSECENNNLIRLRTSMAGAPECRDSMRAYRLRSSIEDSLEDYFSMTCDVWRGQDGELYWKKERNFPGEVPIPRFKY